MHTHVRLVFYRSDFNKTPSPWMFFCFPEEPEYVKKELPFSLEWKATKTHYEGETNPYFSSERQILKQTERNNAPNVHTRSVDFLLFFCSFYLKPLPFLCNYSTIPCSMHGLNLGYKHSTDNRTVYGLFLNIYSSLQC